MRTLRRRLDAHGIDQNRLDLRGPLPYLEHLKLTGQVDVALDAFPYNGQTTTCEALWMGVPVVTMSCGTHVSRVGAALVTRAGYSDWIADTPADYVEIASSLVSDVDRLVTLRGRLRDDFINAGLTDGRMLARSLEDAYNQMLSREPLTDAHIYNTTPIDASSPEYERLLLGLQGNILKGHGRCFTANIFLQFHVEGSALKEVLRSLTKRFVTSAHGQLLQRNQYQAQVVRSADSRTVDPLFGNLLLTRNTYKKLHLEECLAQWFPDPHEDPNDQTLPKNSRFRAGMFEAASDLDDRLTASDAVEPLERAYVEGTIDALLLLANDSDSHLIDIADRLIAELASLRIASTVAFEFGRVLRNDRGQGIEHFGYADGISQPLFFRSDFEKLQQVEPVDKWNPFAPLSLALFRDPGVDDENAFGSYYVFRKLEQNVRAFHTAEAELARTLELDSNDTGRAGAMIVGRFRDGTPLVLSQADGMTPVGSNNFRYDGLLATLEPDSSGSGDRLGLKCPFQSHIRKTNPRQSQNATSSTPCDIAELECAHRGRRIVRRGITYGVASGTELPESGVGLLFGCFQRSIMRQYAFMQRSWANTSGFRVLGPSETDKTGLDPVIGQPRNRTKLHHWRKEYGGVFQIEAGKELEKLDDLPLSSSHTTALGLGDFVTFRGGEFFFAPSLPFLLGTDR